MKPPTLKPIDLDKRGNGHDDCQHPDIEAKSYYLAKIYGKFHAGTFTKQWYGWNFNAVYDAGIQLNSEGFEAMWEIVTRSEPKRSKNAL